MNWTEFAFSICDTIHIPLITLVCMLIIQRKSDRAEAMEKRERVAKEFMGRGW